MPHRLKAENARLREALTNCEHNLQGVAAEQRRAWKKVLELREALEWAMAHVRPPGYVVAGPESKDIEGRFERGMTNARDVLCNQEAQCP